LQSSKDDTVHGSLLALTEFIANKSDIIRDKFKETIDLVSKLKESKDKTVKRTAIATFARLAEFAPEIFVNNYLNTTFAFLLELTKKEGPDRGIGFLAIGDIVRALDSYSHKLATFMDGIFVNLKSAIAVKVPSKKSSPVSFCNEALKCLESLASTLKASLENFMPHDTLRKKRLISLSSYERTLMCMK